MDENKSIKTNVSFKSAGLKSYWIALVLTGDEKKASRIVASGIHEIADSGTVFGEWMCA